MSGTRRAKWNDKDAREVNRIVKNYNARLKRAISKFPENEQYLPDKLSAKEFRERLISSNEVIPDSFEELREAKPIISRKDFNRELKQIDKFRSATAAIETDETGVTKTVWAQDLADDLRKEINKRRKKQRQGASEETGTLSLLERSNLQDKQEFKGDSTEEWEGFIEAMEIQLNSAYTAKGLAQYKENYVNSAYDQLGEYADGIAEKVNQIDDDTFFTESISNSLLNIPYNYGPHSAGDKAFYINHELKKILKRQADRKNGT